MAQTATRDSYTVGWICAVQTELVAALFFLDHEHERADFQDPNDNNTYTLGDICGHNVVIAALPGGEYGTNSAAHVATNMLRSFPSVRIGLMVGIGGGAPRSDRDIRLGDVVVGSSKGGYGGVVQYDFGKKIQNQSFQKTGFLNQAPTLLRTAVSDLRARHEARGNSIEKDIDAALDHNLRLKRSKKYSRPDPATDRLYNSTYIHTSSGSCTDVCSNDEASLVVRLLREEREDDPAVHYGLIGSANQLLKDAVIRDALAEEGVLCLEMEAAGLVNHFPCLIIRGICDYADSHKNKAWQGYSAMAAAAYAKDLLGRITPAKVLQEEKIQDVLSTMAQDIIETRNISRDTNSHMQTLGREVAHQGKGTRDLLIRLRSENIYEVEYQQLLESLHFNTMTSRQDDLEDPYSNTFGWIFDRGSKIDSPGMQFTHWLQTGKGIFWINGKAGSGKSTLMSFLNKSSKLQNSLQQWAGSDKVISPVFFFWRAGTKEQKSINGLLRSLLNQLLKEHPNFARQVNPSIHKKRYTWSSEADRVKICLLVDGLDEFEGSAVEQSELVDLVLALVEGDNVKAVVSSRPELLFEDRLSTCTKIRLQDLNAQDIHEFVEGKLWQEPWMTKHKERCPSEYEQFVDEVASKADGVFLWVRMALSDILEGVWARDSLDMLVHRLKHLDPTLQGIFPQLLRRIHPTHRKYAANYVKFVKLWFSEDRNPANHLSILAVVFACQQELRKELRGLILAQEAEEKAGTNAIHCLQRLNDFGTKLRSQCAGLLDVNLACRSHGSRWSERRAWSRNSSVQFDLGGPLKASSLSSLAQGCYNLLNFTSVNIVHRSAWDFLNENLDGVKFLQMATMSDADREAGFRQACDGTALIGLFVFEDCFASNSRLSRHNMREDDPAKELAMVAWSMYYNFQKFLAKSLPSMTTFRMRRQDKSRLDEIRRWIIISLTRLSTTLKYEQISLDLPKSRGPKWSHTLPELLSINPIWSHKLLKLLYHHTLQHTWVWLMVHCCETAYVLEYIDESYEPFKGHLFDAAMSTIEKLCIYRDYEEYKDWCDSPLEDYETDAAMKQHGTLDCLRLIANLLAMGLKPNQRAENLCFWPRTDDFCFGCDEDTNWQRYLGWIQRNTAKQADLLGFAEMITGALNLAKLFLSLGADPNAWLPYKNSSRIMYLSAGKPKDGWEVYLRETVLQTLENIEAWTGASDKNLVQKLKEKSAVARYKVHEIVAGPQLLPNQKRDKREYRVLRSFTEPEHNELYFLTRAYYFTINGTSPLGDDRAYDALNAAVRKIWAANSQHVTKYEPE